MFEQDCVSEKFLIRDYRGLSVEKWCFLDLSPKCMVVQSLENLEILEKSGNKILVRENLENLEESGNFIGNVIGNNAFSY